MNHVGSAPLFRHNSEFEREGLFRVKSLWALSWQAGLPKWVTIAAPRHTAACCPAQCQRGASSRPALGSTKTCSARGPGLLAASPPQAAAWRCEQGWRAQRGQPSCKQQEGVTLWRPGVAASGRRQVGRWRQCQQGATPLAGCCTHRKKLYAARRSGRLTCTPATPAVCLPARSCCSMLLCDCHPPAVSLATSHGVSEVMLIKTPMPAQSTSRCSGITCQGGPTNCGHRAGSRGSMQMNGGMCVSSWRQQAIQMQGTGGLLPLTTGMQPASMLSVSCAELGVSLRPPFDNVIGLQLNVSTAASECLCKPAWMHLPGGHYAEDRLPQVPCHI